jgi:hypothetical protein
MEEVPLLNEEERAELIALLKEAEAEIGAGNCVVTTLRGMTYKVLRSSRRVGRLLQLKFR